MPNEIQYDIRIPATGTDFERLSKIVLDVFYGTEFSFFGSNGHAQHGIDLYNTGFEICVQCKNYQGVDSAKKLRKEFKEDYLKAIAHFRGKIKKYVLATTVYRDPYIQELAEVLQEEHSIPIDLFFWQNFQQALNPEIIEEFNNASNIPLEDRRKLSDDYGWLCRQYRKTKNMIQYDNSGKPDAETVFQQYQTYKCCFPVTCDLALTDHTLCIIDSQNQYTAPDIVRRHSDELFQAHRKSYVYNNQNIRVDHWYEKDQKLVILTSRTTYYNSLRTNRAMDYRLPNGLTLRDELEWGCKISPLKESVLSNHLGFNGFIESRDGYIPFVKRTGNVSVGKLTLAPSIGASLKAMYALDDDDEFHVEGLLNAILEEIADELCIPKETMEQFTPNNHHIIAAYRDLVEGGKPQLLFYAHCTLTKQEIEDVFYANSKEKLKRLVVDGTELIWIPREDLKELCITPGAMIYRGNVMRMVPSASASVVMLLEHLKRSPQS